MTMVNDDNNFNFAAAGDFGCSKNTQNTVANMENKDPEYGSWTGRSFIP
jgi:hypothetical protein